VRPARAASWIGLALGLAGCELVFPVPEGERSCPDVASSQSCLGGPDEDGDSDPDVCDLCPQDDRGTGDLDADGIGDNCDDDKGTPSPCARFFDGFDAGSRWIPNAAFVFTGTAAVVGEGTLISPSTPGSGRIEVAIRDGLPAIDGAEVGVTLMARDKARYECTLFQPASGAVGGIQVAHLDPANPELEMKLDATPPNAFAMTPGISHRLRFTVDRAGRVDCAVWEVDGGDLSGDVLLSELTATDPNPLVGGAFGIVIRSTTSSVEYVDFIAR